MDPHPFLPSQTLRTVDLAVLDVTSSLELWPRLAPVESHTIGTALGEDFTVGETWNPDAGVISASDQLIGSLYISKQNCLDGH